jgi:leader peptidase (prepilin peptidase) / N-methyltransferase
MSSGSVGADPLENFNTGSGLIHILITPTYAFLLGVCFGSFLNVCILRTKNGGNILFPSASFCPRCKHPLSWYENIPILSFAFLRGKCAHCKGAISLQYPLVEGVVGLLFLVSALVFKEPRQVIASYIWVCFLVLLVVSDIKWRILPHPFNNLFIVGGFLYSGWMEKGAIAKGSIGSVEGFLSAGLLMVVMAHLFPKGLGGGDIKMIAAFGAWLGFSKTALVVLLAFGAGAILTLPLLLSGKVGRKTPVPFGPFLAAAGGWAWFFPSLTQELLDRIA